MGRYYTKLFSSITESTIWVAPDKHLRMWVWLLAKADQHGIVYGSIPGAASGARMTLEEAAEALKSFLSPDPYSRTKDNEGRRIEEVDGGWRLLNHGKYRDLVSADERREYQREWDRTHRKRPGDPTTNPTASDAIRLDPTRPTHTDTDTNTDTLNSKTKSKARAKPTPSVDLPVWLPMEQWKAFVEMRQRMRKPLTDHAKGMVISRLDQFRADGESVAGILGNSIMNSWLGVFSLKDRR